MSLRRKPQPSPELGYCVKDGAFGFSSDFHGGLFMEAPREESPAPMCAVQEQGPAITSNRQAQQHMEAYLESCTPVAMDAMYIANPETTVAQNNALVYKRVMLRNSKGGGHEHIRAIDIYRTKYTNTEKAIIEGDNKGAWAEYMKASRDAKSCMKEEIKKGAKDLPEKCWKAYKRVESAIFQVESILSDHKHDFKNKHSHTMAKPHHEKLQRKRFDAPMHGGGPGLGGYCTCPATVSY